MASVTCEPRRRDRLPEVDEKANLPGAVPSRGLQRITGSRPRKERLAMGEISKVGMRTVGLDLGDRFSRFAVLDGEGQLVEEGRVATRRTPLPGDPESQSARGSGVKIAEPRRKQPREQLRNR